jgi:ubiquinone biosynthesis protein Coq4
MIIRYVVMCTATLLAAIALQGTSAHALSMQECSAKYKAAKDAGTLNGMKWNDFRKAQ